MFVSVVLFVAAGANPIVRGPTVRESSCFAGDVAHHARQSGVEVNKQAKNKQRACTQQGGSMHTTG